MVTLLAQFCTNVQAVGFENGLLRQIAIGLGLEIDEVLFIGGGAFDPALGLRDPVVEVADGVGNVELLLAQLLLRQLFGELRLEHAEVAELSKVARAAGWLGQARGP